METEDEDKLSPASPSPLQPDIDSTVETKNNSDTEENLTSKEEEVPKCEIGLKEAEESQETVVVDTKEEFGVEPPADEEVKAVEVARKEEGSEDVRASDLMSGVEKGEEGVGILIGESDVKEKEECSGVKEAVVEGVGLENRVDGEKVEDLEEVKVGEVGEGVEGGEVEEGKLGKSDIDEVVEEMRESGKTSVVEVKDDEGVNEMEAVEMGDDAVKGDKVEEEEMNCVEAVDMPDDVEKGDKVEEVAVEMPDDVEKGDKVEEEAEEMPDDLEKGDKVEEAVVEMLDEVEKGDKAEEMNDTETMEMPDDVEKGDKVEEEMNSADAGEEVELMEQQNEGNEEGDVEMAEETERMEEEKENVSVNASGKRKRGRNGKATSKAPSRKKMEEDVCFICFDGGDLVICDRRGCPKAYHPSCVNRDEAFFQTKGRWNCGWHLCSVCGKNAYYMCYTCTFSLCKGCIKDGVIFCVRGNKGFCEACIKTIMLIEENGQESNETAQVDFDDRSSWEYLFKDYWIDVKERLSLTSAELAQAKNMWKGLDSHTGRQKSPDELNDAHNDRGSESDGSSGNEDATTPKRRKPRRRLKSRAKERESPRLAIKDGAEGAASDGSTEWASKELLEFVMHMKNGDKSICSQFDVQALLLEYIKRNKLRDPRRKSQIVCDSRLENLFGKPRVGHFEMLKLLESHFLLKEDSQADELQGSVVDTEANQLEADGNSDSVSKTGRDKKRKSRKKGDGRGVQSNVDDYAAIDMYNINLIYLRRTLMESLLEDTDTFNEKVVGAFVRIRISGSSQKQDLYRLVQVVGTSKTTEPYKVGKRMTDFLLEILNLNRTEVVSIDIISNQEFTEDECKRLRQSIKCGFINRLTVGDIREKAIALQAVRVQDSLEAEITRFSHLRDRASDMGRRKELRECVEKLQLLKSPEERQRRLEEIPDIHADPNMDPDHESEEEAEDADDKRQENYLRPRGNNFNRRATEPVSPGKGGFASNDSWGGTRNYSSMNRELSRNMSGKGFPNKGDGVDTITENLRTPVRDRELQQSQGWERPQRISSSEIGSSKSMSVPDSVPKTTQEIVHAPISAGTTQSATKISETEKMWHYRDPSGKIQGPFSMVQLRKWNNTGYFPADLKIWKTNEKQDDSVLLTDALNGNFQKSSPLVDDNIVKTQLLGSSHLSSNYSGLAGEISKASTSVRQAALAPLEVPKSSTDMWASEVNLPSPTPGPSQTSISGGMKDRAHKSRWSPTPAQHVGSVLAASPFSGSHGEQQHPPVIITETGQPPMLTPLIDGNNFARGASLMSKPEVLSSADSQLQSLPSSVQPAFDIKSLQSLVQQVANNPLIATNGWNTAAVSKPEMMSSPTPGSGPQAWVNAPQKAESSSSVSAPMQPSPYGNWGNTPTSTLAIPTHTPGSSTVQTPSMTGLVSSVTWRAPIAGQPNIQPSASSNAQWGMSSASNQSSIPQVQENITAASAWGPMPANPSMGWGGQLNRNQNQSWTPTGQGPSPGNAVMGWGTTVQAQATGNPATGWANPVPGQGYGSTLQAWGQSGQGPTPVNSTSDRVTPGQGPSPGNGNRPNPSSGWTSMLPSGNNSAWASDRNHNGSRPASYRDRDWDRERDRDRDRDRDGDRNSYRGDSGHHGGRSWNKQSSFGRGDDSSRSSYKGNNRGVCKYHGSGRCRKGSSCEFLHT